jgi:NAD-dependent deacetylase
MDEIERVASWLAGASRGVVFTGAGISTESGIPDFRSPGGIWTRYDPRQFTYQRYVAETEVRKLAWSVFRDRALTKAEPNAGHRAIARLEELGVVRGVVTQNVDGLHQDAGARNVLELHGTSKFVVCLSCGSRWPTPEIHARVEAGEDDPRCVHCEGILKRATVSFGQQLPPDVVDEAHRWSMEADVFVVVGSSLVVYPAAAMPAEAKNAGARLVILNREPTPLDDLADAILNDEAGPTLTAIVGRVEQQLGGRSS